MTILKPILDYNEIKEEKDLAVHWVSTHKADKEGIERVGEYEKFCQSQGKKPDPRKLARRLGNNIVHLRQHTLEDGIRYVTIHQENGTEIYDDHKYGGLFTCNCGAIHDHPTTISALWDREEKVNLGDGFKLLGTNASDPAKYGATESFVEKKYTSSGKDITIHYHIRPVYKGDGGSLFFEIIIRTPKQFEVKLLEINKHGEAEWLGKYVTESIISKHVEIKFWSNRKGRGKKASEITIAYNLADNNLFVGEWDQAILKFNNRNMLEKITGVSQGPKLNPEWKDESLLTVIRKGENEWFEYPPNSSEARIFTYATFGYDITKLQYDTRGSLTSLMEAAIKETDIDLSKTLKFI